MQLLIYLFIILIGTAMVIAARVQERRDGEYSRHSLILLNAGTALIVYSLAVKLPDFIAVIIEFWSHR